ncbi:MAG: S8 family serine peptidase [Candidatus Kapaibacterium sp.]
MLRHRPFRTVLFAALSTVLVLVCAAPDTARAAVSPDVVPGRVWLRVRQPHALTPSLLASLKLPGSPRLQRSLLLPSQCVALGAQALRTPETRSMTTFNELRRLEEELTSTYVVEFDRSVDPVTFCSAASSNKTVITGAYPVFHNRPLFTPNDSLVASQEYLNVMRAFQAWDKTRGDSSVFIVISDAGTRTTHEDLAAKVSVNRKEIPGNAIDDDGNGYVDDFGGYNFCFNEDGVRQDNVYNPNEGHGTSVAGIAAAAQNNRVGISGVGANCTFVPVKISSNNFPEDLDYGYESILYAAVRKAAVVNCSWGNNRQGFNPLEQSVIDYATARGTCVVVAGGNHNGLGRPTDVFYPAKYRNVLSVIETNPDGSITSTSSYGSHCSISAPGADVVTTANQNNSAYTSDPGSYFAGTSSAAPMVSGALAVVRSAYPALSPRQAMEHLRVTGTLNLAANPTLQDYVCKTVNMEAAVNRSPFASPSIRVDAWKLSDHKGTVISRASKGDTVLFTFSVRNVLGAASGLACKLRLVDPLGTNCLFFLDSMVNVGSLARDEVKDVGPFKAVITQENTQRTFLRLESGGTGEDATAYADFQLIEFFPTQDFITIGDGTVRFSIGDYGWVGSNQFTIGQRKGDGFSYAQSGNLLYRGGFYCTDAASVVRSGIGTDGTTDHDFLVRSRTEPWPYVLTISDAESDDAFRLGVTLKQSWTMTKSSLAQCDMVITNESVDPLSDFAVGLFLDWDITSVGDSCRVRRFTEGETSGTNSMAELLWRQNSTPYVACMAQTTDVQGRPQAAGLDADFTLGGFTNDRRILALTSRDSIQASGVDDMSMVVGMRFPGIAPKASRSVRFVLGAAPTADSLARLFKENVLTRVEQEAETGTSAQEVNVAPNPAIDVVTISIPRDGIRSATVRDVTGRMVAQFETHAETHTKAHDEASSVTIDTHALAAGPYVVDIRDGRGMARIARFCVVR